MLHKSWLNKGDEFIKKYEKLRETKEDRDKLKRELVIVRGHKPNKVVISQGMFSGNEEIKLNYRVKTKIQDVLIEEIEYQLQKLNKRMEDIESEICGGK